MNTCASSVSLCRHCQYYLPEGRRGGHCKQLNVNVKSHWEACSVAVPPFRPSWERLRELMLWQQKAVESQTDEAIEALELAVSGEGLEATQSAAIALPVAVSVAAGSEWVG